MTTETTRAAERRLSPAVLVGGTFVVRNGDLQLDANPGRPVYGRHH